MFLGTSPLKRRTHFTMELLFLHIVFRPLTQICGPQICVNGWKFSNSCISCISKLFYLQNNNFCKSRGNSCTSTGNLRDTPALDWASISPQPLTSSAIYRPGLIEWKSVHIDPDCEWNGALKLVWPSCQIVLKDALVLCVSNEVSS